MTLANEYRKSVDNLEKAAKAVGMFISEEERLILEYNVFYLKLQPQYGFVVPKPKHVSE